MQNYKFNLALKITNWCNLNCAHCCEHSGCNNPQKLMPIDKITHYMTEFQKLPYDKYEHLVFTGGEVMSPYYHGDYAYIPQCLDIAYRNGYVPFLKTNAVWGGDDILRNRVLNDVVKMAYKHQTLASFDISLDEFHNNFDEVSTLVRNILSQAEVANAIRISLVGLNTTKSKFRLAKLFNELRKHDMNPHVIDYMTIAVNTGQNWVQIYYDYDASIHREGRAADNKIGTQVSDGTPDAQGTCCLVLDNNDNAILNYKWHEPISGRPLNKVVSSLVNQMQSHMK